MKAKNILFKYPKLILLILIIIISYFIFQNPSVKNFILNLNSLSYIGIFLAGMLYTFGFTSPISTGFFIVLNSENILIEGLIAGTGAMLADLLIFRFIRISFMDEFKKLKEERVTKTVKKFFKRFIGKKIRKILSYIFAGILIASPLPDEAGIIILAGLTKLKTKFMAIISLILNTLGIIIILSLVM